MRHGALPAWDPQLLWFCSSLNTYCKFTRHWRHDQYGNIARNPLLEKQTSQNRKHAKSKSACNCGATSGCVGKQIHSRRNTNEVTEQALKASRAEWEKPLPRNDRIHSAAALAPGRTARAARAPAPPAPHRPRAPGMPGSSFTSPHVPPTPHSQGRRCHQSWPSRGWSMWPALPAALCGTLGPHGRATLHPPMEQPPCSEGCNIPCACANDPNQQRLQLR